MIFIVSFFFQLNHATVERTVPVIVMLDFTLTPALTPVKHVPQDHSKSHDTCQTCTQGS